jgi:hypothetical protein
MVTTFDCLALLGQSATLEPEGNTLMMKRFVIERDIPGAGSLTPAQLGEAAKTSNGVLGGLSGVQWEHSYVTKNGTVCIYLAENEEVIREHARLSGFPATRITEVTSVIDPTTERQCALRAAA